MLCCETTFCKRRAYLVLGKARELVPYLLKTRCIDIRRHFLFEVSDLQIVSLIHLARDFLDLSQQTAEQGSLSDTVCPCEDDPVSPLHPEVQGPGQRLLVADHQIMGLEKHLPRGPGFLEVELRLRLVIYLFNDLHIVQLLLTGHGHIPGSDAGLVPGHEVL